MNRIYQGRVGKAEPIDEKGTPLPAPETWDGIDALWQHHTLFQDAVNYYLVCLLALAGPDSDLWPIREKLDAHDENGNPDDLMVWRRFLRRGVRRPGLRDSVAKYLTPGNDQPTPEECFAAVLAGNALANSEEGRARLDEGLSQLLAKCKGESGCRNSSKEFLPRFCVPGTDATFNDDPARRIRDEQKPRLLRALHGADTRHDSPNMRPFGVHSIAFVKEGAWECGPAAAKKFREMIAAWRKRAPEHEDKWKGLEAKVAAKEEELKLPVYAAAAAKGDDRFLLYAMSFFRHLDEGSPFAFQLMRSVAKRPSDDDAPPSAATATTEANPDPIREARGARGYVFRGFTSLACWGGNESGELEWLPFDVAAFQEALKALHQVEAKAKERSDKQGELLTRLEYQRQCTLLRSKDEAGREKVDTDWRKGTPATKKWVAAGETEETAPPILIGDPRIARLEHLVDEELKAEYEMSEGVEVRYGLHQRTIRGFHDLRRKWNDAIKSAPYSQAAKEQLLGILRDYQKENATLVGSVRLFEALLEEPNWLIWREPTAEEQAEWRKSAKLPADAEFAPDPLQALTDERELIEEIERLSGPIRFTPADPEHSRRQFYFYDGSHRPTKGRMPHDKPQIDVEIALKSDGKWKPSWVRIHYSAPRLLRDELNNSGGKDVAFQQAIMAAFEPKLQARLTKKGKPAEFADCAAVALMPEVTATGEKRILLNFPVELDELQIPKQLLITANREYQFRTRKDPLTKKETLDSYWERQMVASYKDRKVDTMFHLRWPSSLGEAKRSEHGWWWEKGRSFSCLSVDLGQRDAGAFALIEASPGKAPKPQSRRLGEAEGTTWWATVRATGMLRLPGENAQVIRDGQWQQEFSGNRGRLATEAEWQEARDICAQLGLVPDKVLGTDPAFHSFPETNDRLLYALRRAQSRLARLQSWSCVDYDEQQPQRKEAFEKRRAAIKAEIVAALAARSEEQAKPEAEREQDAPERGQWLDDVRPHVEKGAWNLVADRLMREVEREREAIKAQLVRIADRIQPLRGRRWEWVPRPGDGRNHILRQTAYGSDPRSKLLAGQRGLSLKRIEQLESLRQRCQSLNRALQQTPGEPARLGRSKRGIELPDPCPKLLDRLEALKEQRVNQTAHLILAQALGVRLKPHAKDKAERTARDIHGEYERIPGREPVDFVVIENLKYYDMSQKRERSTNARLMKWCRRQLRKKLIELCEPYGLRVVEVWPADTSKFCSLTGVAGFRAVELTPEDRTGFRWKKHLDRLADPERVKKLDKDELAESQSVKRLFEQLDTLNADLLKNRPVRPKWRTLLAPMQLGPIFVPLRGKPMQADINAAINLGLRAIASPAADDIHLRIRAERKGDTFVARAENAREKARWIGKPPTISVSKEADRKKLLENARLNFFFDAGQVATFDHATIEDMGVSLASGRGIWGTVNRSAWQRCEAINDARLGRPQTKQDQDDLKMD